MTFTEALVLIMWAMIVQEIPSWKGNLDNKEAAEYREDIEHMVKIDAKVARPGYLVDPQVDRAILGGVRFYEARFQSEPSDGDCVLKRPKINKEKARAMRRKHGGLLPRWFVRPKRVCSAVGPMQIAKGNRSILPAWEEVRILFDGIKSWKQEVEEGTSPWKLEGASMAELRDPEFNVRFGYGTLWHWKNACRGAKADPRDAPVGAWLTAFGWGRCPPANWRSVVYVDREGRRRCEKITTIMTSLEELSQKPGSAFTFEVPDDWWCGHEPSAMPKPVP